MKRIIIGCLLLLTLSLGMMGCSTKQIDNTSELPLLLRYTDDTNHQEQLVQVAWDTKTGTMKIDTTPLLTFSNHATQKDFWVVLQPWAGLFPKPHGHVSNTAIYWNGTDAVTLFTTENNINVQENGLKANVVHIADDAICNQYYNMTNCYATPDKLYVFEQGEATSTVYEYSPTKVTKMTVDGYVMGIGTKNNVTYILSATSTKTGHSLVIHTTNGNGATVDKEVANSQREESYSLWSDAGGWATFANDAFYSNGVKVSSVDSTPRLEFVQSIVDAYKTIASTTTLEPFSGPYPSPAFYEYNGYTIAIGSTFSEDEITIAVFKNDKLQAFALVTDINKSDATITTYDATGKKISSYNIKTSVQIIVPQG